MYDCFPIVKIQDFKFIFFFTLTDKIVHNYSVDFKFKRITISA